MTPAPHRPRQISQITVPPDLKGTRQALFYLLRELDRPVEETRRRLATRFTPPAPADAGSEPAAAPGARVRIVGDDFLFG